MGRVYRVKVDERSWTALECWGLFDAEVGADTVDRIVEALLPWIERACRRLDIPAASIVSVAEALNAMSNELDDLSIHESDKQRAKWYRQDSRALSALYSRVLRIESLRRAKARMEANRG